MIKTQSSHHRPLSLHTLQYTLKARNMEDTPNSAQMAAMACGPLSGMGPSYKPFSFFQQYSPGEYRKGPEDGPARGVRRWRGSMMPVYERAPPGCCSNLLWRRRMRWIMD